MFKRGQFTLHDRYISQFSPFLAIVLDETLAGVLALSCSGIIKDFFQKAPLLDKEFYLLRMGIFSHFMNLRAVYIHLGWFQISITNLIVVLSMLLLFGLALVLPFPGNNKKGGGQK